MKSMEAHERLNLLEGQIPNDNASQVLAEYYIDHYFTHLKPKDGITRVMDLGCGAGNSIEQFRKRDPNIDWIGLDIEDSPEAKSRTRTDAKFHTFDGINIPFEDGYFDLIYSKQVFEHVIYPSELLKEIHRVLKPNGYFVGSTSYLEPYHSYSFWNYTPYGFRILLEKANLQLTEVRPGIDAVALIIWNRAGHVRGLRKLILKLGWWKESPLNLTISIVGNMQRQHPSSINATKLSVCGQFCFIASKSDATIFNGVTDMPITD